MIRNLSIVPRPFAFSATINAKFNAKFNAMNSAMIGAALAATTAMAQAPQAKPADAAPPTGPAPSTAPSAAEQTVPERAFVVMQTSKGDIVLELDGKNAPLSTANFLRYVNEGFYNGTIFHRVIGTFMIQGGGFDVSGTQKPTAPPIKNEWTNGLKNEIGTIAFARTNNPDSATSQFFINVGDNSRLKDAAGVGYAVFGKVIGGMDTVNAIKAVKTGQRTLMSRSGDRTQPMPAGDVPLEIVEIKSAKQVTEAQAKELAASTNGPKSAPAPGAGGSDGKPPVKGAGAPATAPPR